MSEDAARDCVKVPTFDGKDKNWPFHEMSEAVVCEHQVDQPTLCSHGSKISIGLKWVARRCKDWEHHPTHPKVNQSHDTWIEDWEIKNYDKGMKRIAAN